MHRDDQVVVELSKPKHLPPGSSVVHTWCGVDKVPPPTTHNTALALSHTHTHTHTISPSSFVHHFLPRPAVPRADSDAARSFWTCCSSPPPPPPDSWCGTHHHCRPAPSLVSSLTTPSTSSPPPPPSPRPGPGPAVRHGGAGCRPLARALRPLLQPRSVRGRAGAAEEGPRGGGQPQA